LAQKHEPALATVTAASPDDLVIKRLVAEAARAGCTEYCSWCRRHGGGDGQLCRPGGIHYCRVLAAHIAGKISDAQLIAVQVTLGSGAPIPEKLLQLEPWQA
jgi:hypothetical protein